MMFDPIFVPTATPELSMPFSMFMLDIICVNISGNEVMMAQEDGETGFTIKANKEC